MFDLDIPYFVLAKKIAGLIVNPNSPMPMHNPVKRYLHRLPYGQLTNPL
jgi:hypothetical protein